MRRDLPQLGISLIVNLLLIGILWTIQTKPRAPQAQRVTVLTDLAEEERTDTFTERLDVDEKIDLDAAVDLRNTGVGGAPAAMPELKPAPQQTAAAARGGMPVGATELIRPLSGATGPLGMTGAINGLRGAFAASGTGSGQGGTGGSIQRITQEILRQLQTRKVLVVWILDASRGMKDRRTSLALQLERVYKELDTLGANQDGALLTSIAGFGKETQWLLPTPTKDGAEIKKAVAAIKLDDTGIENAFSAIREAALKFRKFQTGGRRTLMIVLMTDEIGDDHAAVDETTLLCERNNVYVYVMGPEASLALPTVRHWMKAPDTEENISTFVDRGPPTREEEILRVPFNGQFQNSGFGPFGLSQLAMKTGGLYFITDDDVVKGPNYNMDALSVYKADFGSPEEYAKKVNQSEYRRTLMETIEQGNKYWREYVHTAFGSPAKKEDIENIAKGMAEFISWSDKTAIPRLLAADKLRDKEENPRWKANFDLTLARVLYTNVRASELNWICAQAMTHSLSIKNPQHDEFIFYTDETLRFGIPGLAVQGEKTDKSEASKKSSPKANEEMKERLAKARFYYERVIKENPDTPWAELAKREKKWQAGYVQGERKRPGPPPKSKYHDKKI